jgi:hypothetical protein
MNRDDAGSLLLALRGWLDDERVARRIAEHVVNRATLGHFAYIRLLLDIVDGPIRLSREEETTGEADWLIVVADNERDARAVRAA